MNMKAITVFALAVPLLALFSHAKGADINFTGLDLSELSSPSGQDFSYVVGSSATTGTVNVKLISGQVNLVTLGSSPDPTGFEAGQLASNLTPYSFQFTFDVPQTFIIQQDETLTNLEQNAFSIPSGTWSLLSSLNALVTNSGTSIGFTGTRGSPPYGDYSIISTSTSFDFNVTNTAGISSYGSAISLDVVPEPSSLALLGIGGAVFLRRRTRIGTAART